jgi:hypothetical protein
VQRVEPIEPESAVVCGGGLAWQEFALHAKLYGKVVRTWTNGVAPQVTSSVMVVLSFYVAACFLSVHVRERICCHSIDRILVLSMKWQKRAFI